MNEEDVKSLAHVYALVADMQACNAEVMGMLSENAYRESRGNGIAYGEEEFANVGSRLTAIAEELTRISDGEIR
jgi:hypothetical protein